MTDVLIVGAGPAGIRAAETLAAAGVKPVVVDEAERGGGQIYRRPPDGFSRPGRKLYGSEAGKAADLHRVFDALVAEGRVRHLPRSSVLGLYRGQAQVLGPDGVESLHHDRLILATGASDRLAPVPGWQSAGVYSLGAAQIALKSQGVAIGRRVVLAGTGPLLTLVAAQYRAAGASVEAVLDTAGLSTQLAGGLRMAAARPRVTARGLAMRARLGGTYRAGVRLDGIDAGAEGELELSWRDGRGGAHRTACDAVAMGWHLRSETALADLAGVPFDWSDTWAQWLPRADEMGRAGGGVYLAGDGLSILGADGAEIAGRLAAIACLADLGLSAPDPLRDLRRMRRMRRFADGIARAFPWPARAVRALPDEAVLCRCEGITAGELRAALPGSGQDANRAKSVTRVGMGRCQGRFCQLAGAEIMAGACGVGPERMGRLRAQPPVRPASIEALAEPRGS
ncbi:FAD/NAD(P)-dependent oxidoreductase [Roseivivax sediminis]|uniref:NADPH-dependent 2,4-dienoyl-CoA reductase, sulfur reductase n=1 Tax=Roseivivax sediminis TaxID=936889 RepID=A0A1I1T9J3_9RHOB|nr:FAD/NAD(P)-binding oxidoreductase [Roseivivax sediminis]SFD55304.1 NADPH-dependent 2,4-dienoyl-CoA reductase, sulfur reductase [Roseivivax sediminis]